jgi:hypothetical protein
MELLEPKPVTVETHKGPRDYVLSKFPAIAGREIVAKYPVSNLPKLGEYDVSEATMLKLMSFVAVPQDGREPLRLTTRALVDNHVPDWETLARLEAGMMEYNVSFFQNGKSFDFLASFAETLKAWITGTLTDLLAASSTQAKPRSTNSEQSTH